MQLSFRWYGPKDPVTLSHIRQIPCMQGIVTSLQDVPIGEVWTEEVILDQKKIIEKHGMKWNVVESLPVHEEIKWGGPGRDSWIEKYKESLRNIGKIRIPIICYNFMPICDWMRTDLNDLFPDGSTGTSYYHQKISQLTLEEVVDRKMPAWTSYTRDEIRLLQSAYQDIGEDGLRENLAYFLRAVIPVAESAGVKLAIHPDDPPWPIFDLPRIVKNRQDLDHVVQMHASSANGITFCTGSLGANPANDLISMIEEFGAKNLIHFAHVRNVEFAGEKNFREIAHAQKSEKSVDIAEVIKTYGSVGFKNPLRPDHGRMIWGESGSFAGYGLYDRALGAMYLQGLWDACRKK